MGSFFGSLVYQNIQGFCGIKMTMERFREILGNIFMWLLVVLIAVSGYYLGGLATLSGFVIIALTLVIINMIGYIMESGQGTALLTMAFSFWFLTGFIPGLIVSNWSLWFS